MIQLDFFTSQQSQVIRDENDSDFERRFWEQQAQTPGGVRVDGHHYRIGCDDDFPKGFGGRRWIVRFHDGRVVETTSLWSQGPIPEAYRSMMPNNATLEAAPSPDWKI